MVPLRRDYDDYIQRAWEALSRIASVYPQQADTLILQLILPGVDELINRKDEPTVGGSIPWRSAENQIVGFRQVLSAAAKSAETQQRHFGRSHRRVATEFMSQLRMGQTKIGSFVITAISPTNPLPVRKDGQSYDDLIAPTGRQVVETFNGGLEALQFASSEYVRHLNGAVFDETVTSGVSLDLVKGMRRVLGNSPASETVISWSTQMSRDTSKVGPSAASRIVFEAQHAPALKAAVNRLQELDTKKQVTIDGAVTDLHRATPGEAGVVEVRVLSGSDVEQVLISLTDNYDDAVESHKAGSLVRVVGTQERINSKYWIVDVKSLRITDSQGRGKELISRSDEVPS
ncbi:hypothetical protein SAMN05445060_0145 [Williamsia sterculiae]|uniref:Uncharacterized protein n=1 Tax=Williamsia sterculiae TaxID=1344003 RepID=A0A1N7CHY4_9NOCA|nr:hypothetical protein SAMN05445060_0145 [Williamsia sterculiae]